MCKCNNLQPQGGKKGDDSREGNEKEKGKEEQMEKKLVWKTEE